MDADPNLLPETRLELAIVAAFFIPISLFIFGWTARVDVHWFVVSPLLNRVAH
jgi:DHA1 family multidrug resistance protein-like MFS transporter